MISENGARVKYDVKKFGDEVLREKTRPVETVDDGIRALAKDMIETMRVERGVGLAAPQVGRTESVFVVMVPIEYDTDDQGARINPDVPMPLVLINPEIIEFSKARETADEGCLSFPGIYAPISRSVEITVKFLDTRGRPQQLHLKKFMARVVQHETDHLDGILLVDRMSRLKRIALAGQLKRLRQETRERVVAG
jgi:peptide deformylase